MTTQGADMGRADNAVTFRREGSGFESSYHQFTHPLGGYLVAGDPFLKNDVKFSFNNDWRKCQNIK